MAVNPAATTTYTLTVTNTELNQAQSQTATVTVTVIQVPVITQFQISGGGDAPGTPLTLSWAVNGATLLTLNGDPLPASFLPNGSLVEAPTGAGSYTLVASNSAGTASQTLTLAVSGSGGLV